MTSQLSRRGGLPSWNRPGLCRRVGGDVRKLARDQLSPISIQTSAGKDQATSKELARIVQLEKNILFLKQQHQETLEQLHIEVENLRNENRELNMKLVMCCCRGRVSRAGQRLPKEGSVISRDDMESGIVNEELQALFLEEEVRKLRNALSIERTKSNRLMRIIEKKVLERQKSSSYDQFDGESNSGVVPSSYRSVGPRSGMPARPRPLSLEDYNVIIKELESKNSQQSHELLQIKADLRDVLYSHKWTPDAFLMARAYVSDDSNSEQETLPPIDTQTSQETLKKAYQRVKEEIKLPALMPKVPSMVAQRQRRAQAVRGRGVTRSLF